MSVPEKRCVSEQFDVVKQNNDDKPQKRLSHLQHLEQQRG